MLASSAATNVYKRQDEGDLFGDNLFDDSDADFDNDIFKDMADNASDDAE